jgi:pyruvate dehydrogenase (quinone)/pyruvate oxidase
VAHLTFPIDYQVTEGKEEFITHHGGPPKTPERTEVFQPSYYAMDGRNAQAAATREQCGPVPNPQMLRAASEILNSGKKVALLVGHGAIHAGHEVEQLSELLGAPVVKALLGKTVIPGTHPNSAGGLGLLGSLGGEEAIEHCDTLFMIGTSFPYAHSLPKPEQAMKFAKALARGQRDGPQIALTAFREKFSEMLGEQDDQGLIGRIGEAITRG